MNKNEKHSVLKKILDPFLKILGIILIILGILGLFLPFLQGIVMIIAGAALLQNKWILKKIKQLKTYLKKRIKKGPSKRRPL